jgi:hypothetical protein
MTTITSEVIPKSINPKARARLIKLQQLKVKRQLGQYFLAWEPQKMNSVTPFDAKGNMCGMTAGFAGALNNIQIKWRIHCYILGRESNGKERIDGFALDINTPCKHSEISDLASDAHWDFIQEYKESKKGKNFITACWIATTRDEIPEELVHKIFTSTGSFGLPSDREEEL